MVKNITAIKWIGIITVLNCGALFALTQCSSFEEVQTTAKPASSASSNRYGSYLAGRFAASERDAESASLYFRSALRFDPQDPALLERALLSEVAGGDLDAAASYGEVLARQLPTAKLPQLVIGVRALRDGGYARAGDAFGKVHGNAAAEIAASVGIAYANYSAGDLAGADAALSKLINLGGTRSFALYHQALIRDLSGKAEEATPLFEEANRLSDGESLRILQAYANHLERQGNKAEAQKQYESFLAKAPENPFIKRDLKRLLAGKPPMHVVSNAKQGMAETLYGIASSSTDDDAIEIPIFYLQLALALDPGHELSISLLADRLETAERRLDANAIYQRMMPTSPLYIASRQQIAQNLQQLEQPDEALKILNQALNGTSDDIQTYQAIGDVQRGEEKFAEAVQSYSRAISLIGKPETRHWLVYYARGIAYERSKQWEKSEADLKFALKLKPDQPTVMNYLAYSWVDRGINIKEALAMLKQAVEARPEDGYIVDSLGWAHFRLGNYKEAVEYLEKAVLLEPGQATINDHLGDAYWRLGRKLEAKFQWQHALAMTPEDGEEPKIRRKLEVGLEPSAPAAVQASGEAQGGK